MITTDSETTNHLEHEIFTCITFSSSKLGPRMVGTAQDWGLGHFTKEVLFSIIHDSLLIRTTKAVLFIQDKFQQHYRIYVLKYARKFYDFRYQGESFAICIFIPSTYNGIVKLDNSIENFDWTQFISTTGNIENLVSELNKKIYFS